MKYKSQILAKLGVKFPGLSKQLLGLIADKLAAKVTEEDQIEGAITALDDLPIPIPEYAKFLQQESDRRVTEALNKSKDDPDDDQEREDTKDTTAKSKKKESDDPIAKLTGLVATLTEQVTNMQKDGTKKTYTEKLHARLAEKKISPILAKNISVESDEELETAVAEIEANHTALKQELINQGLAGGKPPLGGTGGDATKTQVEAAIGEWADKHKPQDSQTTKK
ncbi:hypothetical protein [Chitinophaga varians]|uniref:hypothetical protein n=1 Tax=Chitinophaga varians TaxID=2202339 RepID=UPI00165F91D4|nr:hypothetical protein [Chitinophaga varians]MBC9913181.1 hypothetical protein [Chitinophaga varians]